MSRNKGGFQTVKSFKPFKVVWTQTLNKLPKLGFKYLSQEWGVEILDKKNWSD